MPGMNKTSLKNHRKFIFLRYLLLARASPLNFVYNGEGFMENNLTGQARVDNRVRTFRKLLLMCAACKKIRGDDGRWGRIDRYFAADEDEAISHGICPECARTLYPEYCRLRTP